MFSAFEGLHNNIKFVIIGCTQRKLFKGNDQQGEREQSIVTNDYCDNPTCITVYIENTLYSSYVLFCNTTVNSQ